MKYEYQHITEKFYGSSYIVKTLWISEIKYKSNTNLPHSPWTLLVLYKPKDTNCKFYYKFLHIHLLNMELDRVVLDVGKNFAMKPHTMARTGLYTKTDGSHTEAGTLNYLNMLNYWV